MRRSSTEPHPQVERYSYVNQVDAVEIRCGGEVGTNTLRGSACRFGDVPPNSGDALVTSASRGVTTRPSGVSSRGAGSRSHRESHA